MIKKIVMCSMVAVMAIASLVGCGSDSNDGGTTPPPTPPPSSVIKAGGSVTDPGAGANTTYEFATGTEDYTYTITGFGAGDSLKFPVGATPTVSNQSYADGSVSVIYAASGKIITVVLPGQTTDNDKKLNFIVDFNTVFGAGTIK